jgi:hypothetical protein
VLSVEVPVQDPVMLFRLPVEGTGDGAMAEEELPQADASKPPSRARVNSFMALSTRQDSRNRCQVTQLILADVTPA